MIILGIETSCDDTGIALIECDKNKKCRILSNVISSQTEVHTPYGGIVPNLAARAHLKNIEPVLKKSLKEAGHPNIDLIAVTEKPGLAPCLLVGLNFAKALAYNWQKPIIKINHIKGHIYANWFNKTEPKFPLLALVVSGGHTQLVLMKNHKNFKILGETRDDAVGEAFDKVAKLLGLKYPGGPLISSHALKGDSSAFDLPRPMIHSKNYDFSFSGLKTSVLYKVKKEKKISQKYINNMAASFQQAALDVLIKKTIQAAKEHKVKTVILSGGVAANLELRTQLKKSVKELKIKFQMPNINLCTDNGAMIAMAAFFVYNKHYERIT